MPFLWIHVVNTWRKEHILRLLYFIIVSILSSWDGREDLNCIVFLRGTIRKEAQAVLCLCRDLCSQWKQFRSSEVKCVNNRVAFYLSVLEFLSWQRWQGTRARLERLGVTAVTLHKQPNLTGSSSQNPQMSMCFIPISSPLINCRKRGNEAIPIGE